jgi:glycogen synthase
MRQARPRAPRRADRKRALQRACGLPASSRALLVALVSPLDEAHGSDRLAAILERLVPLELQLVATPCGEGPYAAFLRRYASAYPRQVRCLCGCDAVPAERVLEATDLLLAPADGAAARSLARSAVSRGAIPVLTREGAAGARLLDASEAPDLGLAFTFEHSDPDSLLAAIRRALVTHADRPRWRRLLARARRAGRMRDF